MALIKGLWLDIANYRRDTAYLTQEEKGAYLDLMIACAERGGLLQSDQTLLKFVSKLSSRAFKNFFPKFSQIFKQHADGGWHCETVDFQLQRAEKIREARQAAGQSGAQVRWQKPSQTNGKDHGNPMANDMANDMANATLNLESMNPPEPNGSSAPPYPPAKRGGRRARRIYQPSPRTVQIEGFAHALAERERKRDC